MSKRPFEGDGDLDDDDLLYLEYNKNRKRQRQQEPVPVIQGGEEDSEKTDPNDDIDMEGIELMPKAVDLARPPGAPANAGAQLLRLAESSWSDDSMDVEVEELMLDVAPRPTKKTAVRPPPAPKQNRIQLDLDSDSDDVQIVKVVPPTKTPPAPSDEVEIITRPAPQIIVRRPPAPPSQPKPKKPKKKQPLLHWTELPLFISTLCFPSRKLPHFKRLFFRALYSIDYLVVMAKACLDTLETDEKIEPRTILSAQKPALRETLYPDRPQDPHVPGGHDKKMAFLIYMVQDMERVASGVVDDPESVFHNVAQGAVEGPCPDRAFPEDEFKRIFKAFRALMRVFFFLKPAHPITSHHHLPKGQTAFHVAMKALWNAERTTQLHVFAETIASAIELHQRKRHHEDHFYRHLSAFCDTLPEEFTRYFMERYMGLIEDEEHFRKLGFQGDYNDLAGEMMKLDALARQLDHFQLQVNEPNMRLKDYQQREVLDAVHQELLTDQECLVDQAGIRGRIINMAAGLGKTILILMLSIFSNQVQHKPNAKTLLILPVVAFESFRKDAFKFFNETAGIDLYRVEGNVLKQMIFDPRALSLKSEQDKKTTLRPTDEAVRFLVVSHEVFSNFNPYAANSQMAQEVLGVSWERVILDESQMWKGRLSARYALASVYLKRRSFYCLTGTVMTDEPAHVVTQLRLLGYHAADDQSISVGYHNNEASFRRAETMPDRHLVEQWLRDKAMRKGTVIDPNADQNRDDLLLPDGTGGIDWYKDWDNLVMGWKSGPCLAAIRKTENSEADFSADLKSSEMDHGMSEPEALVNQFIMEYMAHYVEGIEEFWTTGRVEGVYADVEIDDAALEEEEKEIMDDEALMRQSDPFKKLPIALQVALERFFRFRSIVCDMRSMLPTTLRILKAMATRVMNRSGVTDEDIHKAQVVHRILDALVPYNDTWLRSHYLAMTEKGEPVEVPYQEDPNLSVEANERLLRKAKARMLNPDNNVEGPNGMSSRYDAILDDLQKHLAKDLTNKALVFFENLTHLYAFGRWMATQFQVFKFGEPNRTLDAVYFAYYSGQVKSKIRRNEINKAFNDNPHLRVILLTFKVGGAGLNYQAANLVVIGEPIYSNANFVQAAKRAHRQGQKRDVDLYYYYKENSCERLVDFYRKHERKEAKKLDKRLDRAHPLPLALPPPPVVVPNKESKEEKLNRYIDKLNERQANPEKKNDEKARELQKRIAKLRKKLDKD